jgi:hypothetical protein
MGRWNVHFCKGCQKSVDVSTSQGFSPLRVSRTTRRATEVTVQNKVDIFWSVN